MGLKEAGGRLEGDSNPPLTKNNFNQRFLVGVLNPVLRGKKALLYL